MFASSPNPFLQSSNHLITASKIPKNKPYLTSSCVRFSTTAKTNRSQKYLVTAEMASPSSLYEVLGIPVSASSHDIKAAYRRLARMIHPDVVSINQKDMSANEFMKIHTAYSTLSDPNKRADYDRDLYRRKRPFGSSSLTSSAMAAASASMSGYTCRNWETDQCW